MIFFYTSFLNIDFVEVKNEMIIKSAIAMDQWSRFNYFVVGILSAWGGFSMDLLSLLGLAICFAGFALILIEFFALVIWIWIGNLNGNRYRSTEPKIYCSSSPTLPKLNFLCKQFQKTLPLLHTIKHMDTQQLNDGNLGTLTSHNVNKKYKYKNSCQ